MSGPNPPGPDSEGADDLDQEPGESTAEEDSVQDATGETEIHSRAYSAPESEQFTAGPYVPADPELYDYDDYDKTDAGGHRQAAALALGGRSCRDHRRHLPCRVGFAAGDGHGLRQPRRTGWADVDDIGTARAGRDHHDDPAAAATAAVRPPRNRRRHRRRRPSR